MRRRKAPVREIMADPIYNSKVITKFVNTIMLDGKKSTAEKNFIWCNCKLRCKEVKKKVLIYLKKQSKMLKPLLEVRSRRVWSNIPSSCWSKSCKKTNFSIKMVSRIC